MEMIEQEWVQALDELMAQIGHRFARVDYLFRRRTSDSLGSDIYPV